MSVYILPFVGQYLVCVCIYLCLLALLLPLVLRLGWLKIALIFVRSLAFSLERQCRIV
nr:MAG TPA: hypothetical protein [Caudoviricetes sp.]